MTSSRSHSGMEVLAGRIVLRDRVVDDGAVAMAGGRIAYAGPRGALDVPAGAALTELPPGALLLPGLVDVHCHGAAGGEFGTDPDGGRVAAWHHHHAGTTTVVASLVSAPPETLVAGMRAAAALRAEGEVAGAHVEGPFLSPARRGAQDPTALTSVDLALVDALAEASDGAWATMTFAPEVAGAHELLPRLADAGVLPCVGHTDADYATTARALAGCAEATGRRPLVTHLFNGMRPMHHRDPGAVGACLSAAARQEALVELIADGVHLADETVGAVFDIAGPDSVVLVTDAMAASGMPEGRYRLGRLDVVVESRTARLADGSSIAGGVATLLDVVRRCVQDAGVELVEAVRAASATPAHALGVPDVGELAPGLLADVLAVDSELHPLAVWRRGERCRPAGSRA